MFFFTRMGAPSDTAQSINMWSKCGFFFLSQLQGKHICVRPAFAGETAHFLSTGQVKDGKICRENLITWCNERKGRIFLSINYRVSRQVKHVKCLFPCGVNRCMVAARQPWHHLQWPCTHSNERLAWGMPSTVVCLSSSFTFVLSFA